MASLSKIIEVHSHPILPFGEGAPMGKGQKQPDWSVEGALSFMDENGSSDPEGLAQTPCGKIKQSRLRPIPMAAFEVTTEVLIS